MKTVRLFEGGFRFSSLFLSCVSTACTNQDKEVFILVEDTLDQTDSKTAAEKLSEQLYSSDSNIRLLYYKTQTPLNDFGIEHRLLEIREELLQLRNRKAECTYNIMARNFLGSLEFKRNTKGVIFIEDGQVSSKVAELMFKNVSQTYLRIYRVLKDVKNSLRARKTDVYSFVKDIHISRWSEFFSIGYRRFPEICYGKCFYRKF